MTYFRVSSMLLVLLLVLVFPHMDKALGEQMQPRKLKETYHHDQVTTLHKRVLVSIPKWNWCFKWCKKGQDVLDRIPKPPPPPPNVKKILGRKPPPPRRS